MNEDARRRAVTTDTIQEFLVKLGFEVDKKSLTSFLGGMESASFRIAAFGAAMAGAALAVVHSVKEIADENYQLDLLAQQMGGAAASTDDFIDTASMLGIKTEDTVGSLKAFAGNVASASVGVGRAKLVFKNLKIEVNDLHGKMRPAIDVMDELREKMLGLNRAQQLRIMGRLGLDPALLTMFNDQFGQTKRIADELNNIDAASGFDLQKAIDQSKEFTNSWKNMTVGINLFKLLFSKMHEAIAVHMMPRIISSINTFAKTVEEARHLVMDNAKQIEAVLEPIIDVILRIGTAFMKLVGTAFNIISSVLKPVFDMMISVNEATDGWAGYIAAALVAWKVFNLGFLATPLGAILALSVGILALIDDFQVWKEGGDSLIDWTEWEPSINFLIDGIGNIIDIFFSLIEVLNNVFHGDWGGAFIALASVFQNIGYAVINLAKSFGNLLIKLGDLLGFDMRGFVNGFSEAFNFASDMVKNLVKWLNTAIDIGGKIGDVFGKIGSGFSKSMGTLEQKFQTTLGVGSGTQTSNVVNQNTNIHVNGAQSPQQTAQLVHAQQSNVNAQVTRNMRAGVR